MRFVLVGRGCIVFRAADPAAQIGDKLQTLPATFRHERQRRGCGRIPCCVSFIESFLTLIEYRITVQLLRLGAGLLVLAQFRRLSGVGSRTSTNRAFVPSLPVLISNCTVSLACLPINVQCLLSFRRRSRLLNCHAADSGPGLRFIHLHRA